MDWKKRLKKKASKDPDKYYPTETLKKLGFSRRRCECGNHFWSSGEREHCEEPECRQKAGKAAYGFIGDSPTKKKYGYKKSWNLWKRVFKGFGHRVINRYPVVARWREDIPFVEASIDNFHPYVITGEVKPPANPLLVPQFCLRFNDIDNIGLSGRHYSGFVMIGEHAFNYRDNQVYFKEKGIEYVYELLKKFGLPDQEIVFHEDAWAGSGALGTSLEFFTRGCELGNQVYTEYEQGSRSLKPLDVKVIDMGAGLNRYPWVSQGTPTSYEVVFPSVMRYLVKRTGVKKRKILWKKFSKHSGTFNVDETNPEKNWRRLSKEMGERDLHDKIEPMKSLYSIADHTRSLLVTLTDGALPSNVGGGYNLRYILRRCFSLIEEFGWDLEVTKVINRHKREFGRMYPEVKKTETGEIIKVEKERWKKTKRRGRKIVKRAIKKKLSASDLVEMYNSHGILPETVEEVAEEEGIDIEIPDNFYSLLEKTEKKGKKRGKKKVKKKMPKDLPETKVLYYMNIRNFKADVVKKVGDWVFLDRTAFYPQSGGQQADSGWLNGKKVLDVQKFGKAIGHKCPGLKKKKVEGKIDWERRKQLTHHHTATHIVNLAARKVLGNHINQAGAKKEEKIAHLDMTHYRGLEDREREKIESVANDIVNRDLKIKKESMDRSKAEEKYGFHIYQGGAVPGKELRIVSIGEDHEACGGTHCSRTGEVGLILILSTERVQDGVVRLTFVSGKRAKEVLKEKRKLLKEVAEELGCKEGEIVKKASELFKKWKSSRKDKRKKRKKEAKELIKDVESETEGKKLVGKVDVDAKTLKAMVRQLSEEWDTVLLFGEKNVFGYSQRKNMGKVVKKICSELGGKGGGSKKIGQGIYKQEPDLKKVVKKI